MILLIPHSHVQLDIGGSDALPLLLKVFLDTEFSMKGRDFRDDCTELFKSCPYILGRFTHLWPFSKSKFHLKSDRVNLVAPASPIECLLYLPMSGWYCTNWDRKGWPGSEIQMYYGCPWPAVLYQIIKYSTKKVH